MFTKSLWQYGITLPCQLADSRGLAKVIKTMKISQPSAGRAFARTLRPGIVPKAVRCRVVDADDEGGACSGSADPTVGRRSLAATV